MKKGLIAAIILAMLGAVGVVGVACEGEKAPEAGFSANPTTGTAPLSLQFTDQSTGDITEWAWDFDNDGATDSAEQNPSYSYESAGEYTVSLKVTGPGGSDTETKTNYIAVEPEEFKLTEWSVIDDNGAAALQASVSVTGSVNLILTDPDGVERDSDSCDQDVTEVKLKLASKGETPKPGAYTLLVTDAQGNEITTETFDFTGAKLAVSVNLLGWTRGSGLPYPRWSSGLHLGSIGFTVTNTGDVPAYIGKTKISVLGRGGSFSSKQVVLPGGEKVISKSRSEYALPSESPLISKVPSGQRTLTLELEDSAGRVIWTSAEIESSSADRVGFRLLTEWSVIDDGGTAALRGEVTSDEVVNFAVVDPDGIERGWDQCNQGVDWVKVKLAGKGETPNAGHYRLLVKDAWGNEASSQAFNFAGARLAVSGLSLGWSSGLQWQVLYGAGNHLISIEFTATNSGDLPAYIKKLEINVGGRSGSDSLSEVVMPGSEGLVSESRSITRAEPPMVKKVPGGQSTLTLTVKDGTGKVICTHSQTVTVH